MRRITERKEEVRVKEKNTKNSDLKPGNVCRKNINVEESGNSTTRRRRFWHATHDCVAPYVDIILHRERF